MHVDGWSIKGQVTTSVVFVGIIHIGHGVLQQYFVGGREHDGCSGSIQARNQNRFPETTELYTS